MMSKPLYPIAFQKGLSSAAAFWSSSTNESVSPRISRLSPLNALRLVTS